MGCSWAHVVGGRHRQRHVDGGAVYQRSRIEPSAIDPHHYVWIPKQMDSEASSKLKLKIVSE